MSKPIVPANLQTLGLKELWSLHAAVRRELAASAPGSCQHRNALVSLENIRRAINARCAGPKGPAM